MSVRGAPLEAAIWHDVEDFLRNPGPALAQLAHKMGNVTATAERVQDDLARWQQQLGTKQGEKDSVIALYRRGRIDGGELDRQLDRVQVEEADLRARVDALQQQLRDGQSARERLTSAEAMLRRGKARGEGPAAVLESGAGRGGAVRGRRTAAEGRLWRG